MVSFALNYLFLDYLSTNKHVWLQLTDSQNRNKVIQRPVDFLFCNHQRRCNADGVFMGQDRKVGAQGEGDPDVRGDALRKG
jgi:hypothetical protein